MSYKMRLKSGFLSEYALCCGYMEQKSTEKYMAKMYKLEGKAYIAELYKKHHYWKTWKLTQAFTGANVVKIRNAYKKMLKQMEN
ncbi:MAG: hypothetical protein AMQ22_00942 [Candidatus Methanofastidiosum methylothiophilum]|uniref:Uncharacterized protein n=1 Tax=Candidatus Methanofastidiosum methylothiophilum TaxID=1705564 RepID=A0A150J524_9EURY|nr:MAG: hypothetical protein AMQ22_00942 [Candidatus Methanofastidiosum methylthiophilus]